MHFKSTIRSAATSYFGTISTIITGLLTIRLATQYLSKEEFGLWSFTMQTVGYLLLLDLGVSSSVGRLFGEPLASGDTKKADEWFTLSLLTLTCQTLLILGAGLVLCPLLLKWFDIPAHLRDKASILWLAFLGIRAGTLIFTLSFAILHAQNRVYWSNIAQALGTWGGLAAFALMLTQGWGVMAYAWSAATSAAAITIGGLFAVWRGGHRFHLTLSGLTKANLRRLFGFSSSIFILGLAAQIYFASQSLVATKLLGLESAAILAVTYRAASMAISTIWKPYDAFSPRWQIAYCNDDLPRIAREFTIMTRFTILITVAAAAGVAMVNQSFISWWTKPEYFGGLALNLLFCAFIIVQGINRCFCTLFPLSLRMRKYTAVSLSSVATSIMLMFVLTRWLGLIGIPMALVLTDLSFPTWYYLTQGPKILGVNGFTILLKDVACWIPVSLLATIGTIFLPSVRFPSDFLRFAFTTALATVIVFPLIWRAYRLIRELKNLPEDISLGHTAQSS